MIGHSFYLVILYFIVLLLLIKPLGAYIANVYQGNPKRIDILLRPIEQLIYRLAQIKPREEMDWKRYLFAMLIFNFFGLIFLYVILRLQFYLPFNPQGFKGTTPELTFNTAASFITNTNWQTYAGENTLSYLSQMLGLTVQNFLSAATGLALLMALIRGIQRAETNKLGNFWVDIVRGTLYILLPLSILFAILLTSQGVIQNFKPYQTVQRLQPMYIENQLITTQTLPMGPVASQIAIKQLGTNGGGFFNTNAAHPFENPTPLTNFLEMLAILLIPAALCHTFGVMVNDKRQGFAILMAMLLMFIPFVLLTMVTEEQGNPLFKTLPVTSAMNMEGKETRFGIVDSVLWGTATTATSNGSVNAMHDSFLPLSGLSFLALMHVGEIIFGGVGSGLYGMLMMIIITVFAAGLMVGRTPEYLGKKVEPYEMKMACIAVLLMPLIVLLLTGFASVTTIGKEGISNPGAHGFSQILYGFTSMGNNNGSAFAGLNANTLFYEVVGGFEMLLLRFWIAIPTLAIAGSLARKKIIPVSLGTLPTHTLLFICLMIGVTFIIGALTFLPALALGPIIEHLILWK